MNTVASKEERESGVKGAILGNVKVLGEFGGNAPAQSAAAGSGGDDIPFAPLPDFA